MKKITTIKKKIILVTFLLFLIPYFRFAEDKISVANAAPEREIQFLLLRPDTNHPFWILFESAMNSACKDLGCKVEVKKADWDSYKMVEQVSALKNSPQKPDVVFFQSFKGNGPQIIQALQDNKIDGFLINAGLTPAQSEQMGKPREKYSHWIGQMLPNDTDAGETNAEAIYKEAKLKGFIKDGKVQIAGIEGISTDGASIERPKGLHNFVEKHPDVELLQVVQGKWDPQTSQKLTNHLMRRYPDLHVIWSAGDPIALGVIAAKSEKIGVEIITAGVDWAPDALDAIEKGTLLGSSGGHFMEGAWAVALAFDYKKGIDFINDHGLELKSSMGFLTKDNIAQYKQKFGKGDFDSIDFKSISQFYGAKPRSYKFDISEFVK